VDSICVINVEFIAIVFGSFSSTFVVYHAAIEFVAQNRAAHYLGNKLHNSATLYVAPCDTPCHRVKVVARCDITLSEY